MGDFKDKLTREELTRLGEVLHRVDVHIERANDTLKWWLGDWLNYGNGQYGEEASQALEQYEAESLRNFAWVADKVKLVTRVTTLSWHHHQVVAALESKQQQY